MRIMMAAGALLLVVFCGDRICVAEAKVDTFDLAGQVRVASLEKAKLLRDDVLAMVKAWEKKGIPVKGSKVTADEVLTDSVCRIEITLQEVTPNIASSCLKQIMERVLAEKGFQISVQVTRR